MNQRRKETGRYRAIAAYYDAEFDSQSQVAQDVPFFLSRLPETRQSILELGVGTGRAAIPLAQAGHEVVGVDYAQDMLEIARQKRDAVGLGEGELRLVHADVLDLELGRTFDWVCIFFNTFLGFVTLEEQDRVLQAVRRHLGEGGRFWLDIFQPDLRLLSREVSRDLDPWLFYVPQFDRTVFQTTEVRRDPSRQVQHVTYHYRWFDNQGQPQHEQTRFDMTFIFPRELRILLERNGLALERIYGGYDASALGPDSPRMIACCVRGE